MELLLFRCYNGEMANFSNVLPDILASRSDIYLSRDTVTTKDYSSPAVACGNRSATGSFIIPWTIMTRQQFEVG